MSLDNDPYLNKKINRLEKELKEAREENEKRLRTCAGYYPCPSCRNPKGRVELHGDKIFCADCNAIYDLGRAIETRKILGMPELGADEKPDFLRDDDIVKEHVYSMENNGAPPVYDLNEKPYISQKEAPAEANADENSGMGVKINEDLYKELERMKKEAMEKRQKHTCR